MVRETWQRAVSVHLSVLETRVKEPGEGALSAW